MALSLIHKGAERRELEAGALTAEMGQPARDPLSSQMGPGSQTMPPPTPGPRLCLNKLPGLLLHGNEWLLLFQSDAATLFSTVCFSLKSCHWPDF